MPNGPYANHIPVRWKNGETALVPPTLLDWALKNGAVRLDNATPDPAPIQTQGPPMPSAPNPLVTLRYGRTIRK